MACSTSDNDDSKSKLLEPALLKSVLLTDNQVYLPLGTRLVGLYVAEYLQDKYPNMPAMVYKDVVKFMLLPRSLGRISVELGVSHARVIIDKEKQTTSTTAFCSIVGLIFDSQGEEVCQRFLKNTVGPTLRQLAIKQFITVPQAALVYNHIFRNAEYRILNESGRQGNQSMFHVGVFSNGEFRGEGAHRNLKKAKELSAENALISIYTSAKPFPKINKSDVSVDNQ